MQGCCNQSLTSQVSVCQVHILYFSPNSSGQLVCEFGVLGNVRPTSEQCDHPSRLQTSECPGTYMYVNRNACALITWIQYLLLNSAIWTCKTLFGILSTPMMHRKILLAPLLKNMYITHHKLKVKDWSATYRTQFTQSSCAFVLVKMCFPFNGSNIRMLFFSQAATSKDLKHYPDIWHTNSSTSNTMYIWTVYMYFDIVYVRLYEYVNRRLNSYKGQGINVTKWLFS